MNITELDNFTLDDAVVFHNTLNDKLWRRNKMRPEVRGQLMKIARHFAESMDINMDDIIDVTISGSNAAYTYTPHSDIDLHLIARTTDMNNEVYKEFFNLKKNAYNNAHDIKIRGIEVEVYVQIEGEPHASSGVYSVMHQKWKSIPRKVKATVDDDIVSSKVDNLSGLATAAIKADDIDAIENVKERIYSMRRAGLEEYGEFSPENLAFKILRTHGVIDDLRDAYNDSTDAELSLEQQNKIDASEIVAEWIKGAEQRQKPGKMGNKFKGKLDMMSAAQLRTVQNTVNNLWNKMNINISLPPSHFLDRINNDRNVWGKYGMVEPEELIKLFAKVYKKYGFDLTKINDEVEVLFTDLASSLNIPVIVKPKKKGHGLDIIAKTIMRKKNFKSNDPVAVVENKQDIMEVPMSPGALKKFGKENEANLIMGFEAEVYVPDIITDPEYEPDYTNDPYTKSTNNIIEFFSNAEITGGLTRSDKESLQYRLDNAFFEWRDEKINDAIDADDEEYDDHVRQYLLNNDYYWRDFLSDAKDELGEDAPNDKLRELARKLASAQVDQEMEDRGSMEYDAAVERVRDELWDELQDSFSEDDFYETGPYKRMSDIERRFEIAWPMYNTVGGTKDMDGVASDLGAELGVTVVTGEYHENKYNTVDWRIEEDASLDRGARTADAGGLEFISPPLPFREAVSKLKEFIVFAKNNEYYTNKNTGFHINLSVKDQTINQLDYIKLVLFSGDMHLLEEFNRTSNIYAQSAMEVLQKNENVVSPPKVAVVLDAMRKKMNKAASKIVHNGITDKYISINNQGNYVEFRGPGGDWLRGGEGNLINAALRFAQALTIATDEEAYKKEYAKKMYKLLSAKGTPHEEQGTDIFALYSSGSLTKEQFIFKLKKRQAERVAKKNGEPVQGTKRKKLMLWTATDASTGRIYGTVKAATMRTADVKARADFNIPDGVILTIKTDGNTASEPDPNLQHTWRVINNFNDNDYLTTANTEVNAIRDIASRTGDPENYFSAELL